MADMRVRRDAGSKTWFVYRDDDDIDINKDFNLTFDLLVLKTGAPTQPPPPPRETLASTDLFLLDVPRSNPNQSLRISVKAGIWAFGGAEYRESVCPQFDDFMRQIEALESRRILPGGAQIIRRGLAHSLPATFAESLYFHYGFFRRAGDNPQAYLDLQPGMRLRLDTAISQFVPPSLAGRDFDSLLNGYVAGGQSFFYITETTAANGTPRIGFDSFLAASLLPRAQPNRGGASGVADLLGSSHRYVRLCYPVALPSSDAAGRAGPSQNITLIGADTLAILGAATQQYYQRGDVDATDSVSVAYFRGRAMLIPEIPCLLNDALAYVPLGTTYRQLIQRFVVAPRIPLVRLDSLFPYRRYVPRIRKDDGPRFQVDQVSVDFAGVEDVSPVDCFDLPVLATDQVTFHTS